MKPEEAKLLDKQCFDAIADLLEATEEQAATIFSALSTIHNECMAEDSQVSILPLSLCLCSRLVEIHTVYGNIALRAVLSQLGQCVV